MLLRFQYGVFIYHHVLIHVYSTMTTKLAIIPILRNATPMYTYQTHEKKYDIIIYKNTHTAIPVFLL